MLLFKTPDRMSGTRWMEIPVGLVSLALAVALIYPGIGLGYELLRGHSDAPIILIVGVLVLGVFFAVAGFRLVTGRERKGGGLLPPFALRLGGLFFLGAPIIMLLEAVNPASLWRSVLMIGAAIACFALANRRSKQQENGPNHDIWTGMSGSNHPTTKETGAHGHQQWDPYRRR